MSVIPTGVIFSGISIEPSLGKVFSSLHNALQNEGTVKKTGSFTYKFKHKLPVLHCTKSYDSFNGNLTSNGKIQ